MKKPIFLAIALAALAGCGNNLPKPVDPLLALGVAPGRTTENADLRPYQARPVGLLLSRNTQRLIDWQEQEVAHAAGRFVVNPLAARSDSDSASLWDNPAVIPASATGMLQEKFKDVVPVQDLAAAANGGLDLVALLDVQATESGCSATAGECMPIMQAQYTLVFLDAKAHTQVAALRAVGSSGYCDLERAGDEAFNHSRCIQEARVRALEALRTRLDAMLPDLPPRRQAGPQVSSADAAGKALADENRKTIETGSAEELYSLGLRMESAGDSAVAGEAYQAIARRYPDSPYAAKALGRQEALVAH